MLEFRGVSVGFRAGTGVRLALRDVSFTVPAGSCTVVAGASGAGKTTLMHCGSGVIPHLIAPASLSGRVTLKGVPVAELPPRQLYQRVGVVLQRVDHQLWEMSVEDLVAFPLENRGAPRQHVRRRVVEVVQQLGLSHLVGRRVRTLSGGEKRSVAIAAALAGRPELLVLDKPSTGLDPGARMRMRSILRSLRAFGQTVLLAEQDLSWLLDLADRIVLLTPDGSLLGSWPVPALLRDPEPWKGAGLEPPPLVRLGWRLQRAGLGVQPEAMGTVADAAEHLRTRGVARKARRFVTEALVGPPSRPSDDEEVPLLETRDLTVGIHVSRSPADVLQPVGA